MQYYCKDGTYLEIHLMSESEKTEVGLDVSYSIFLRSGCKNRYEKDMYADMDDVERLIKSKGGLNLRETIYRQTVSDSLSYQMFEEQHGC